MLMKWGSVAVLALATLMFPSQPVGPAVDVAVKTLRDGSLSVTETVTVPGGQQVVRHVPKRVVAGDDQDRVYLIWDVKVTGPGKADSTEDELLLTLGGGQSVITYTVDGSVADVGGGQQVRWQVAGGWSADLARVTASFTTPGSTSVDCFAGPTDSSQKCSLSEVDHSGIVRVEQDGLKAGERVDLAVQVPAGTVPANARFEQPATIANAFSSTPLTGIGLGVLAFFLILGALFVWWLRKRDAGAFTADAALPDGVPPGLVGTVIDEAVDVVDISATVVDLAVRSYLSIAEVPGDWRLSRRNTADEHLLDFERAILDALFPDGVESVRLYELRARRSLDFSVAREAVYEDVVRKRWFARRNRLTWLGAGLVVLGLVSTVVLTFTVGYALLGVAVAIAGVSLTLAAGWVPSRTARGRVLVGQVRGLLHYLQTVEVAEIPEPDRELVFSRSLPFAVVLGETTRWLETFAGLDGAAGLYWFGGMEGEPDLRRFAAHLPAFLTALDGLLAESGHLRSIRPEPVPV
jgi:hypothetical protein